jgi:tyrosine-protein phosphatase YwqE
MIDLHCHILPGIDDGPELLDESIEMCRIAVKRWSALPIMWSGNIIITVKR